MLVECVTHRILLQISIGEPASKDVYDFLILEHEHTELENMFRIANVNFNNAILHIESINDAFIQLPLNPVVNPQPQLQSHEFEHVEFETFLTTFNEESEVQAVFRGEF